MKSSKFDKQNFSYILANKFKVIMYNGELTIDDVSYEKCDDNPIYDFAIVVAAAIVKYKNEC